MAGGARPVHPATGIRMLIGMTIPLTGTQYEIEAGGYRATVTELGAGLRGLRFGDTFLVTGFDADELPPHGATAGGACMLVSAAGLRADR